jgi:hypothetical protein
MKLTTDQKKKLLDKARDSSQPRSPSHNRVMQEVMKSLPKPAEMLAEGGVVDEDDQDDDLELLDLSDEEESQDTDAEERGETKGFGQYLAERKTKSSIFKRRG